MKPAVLRFLGFLALAVATPSSPAATDAAGRSFDFGSGPVKPGYLRVVPSAAYSAETGYGFEHGPGLASVPGGIASDGAFSFSVKLPEGNYNVAATLGDGRTASVTTIKAESRRLMVEATPVPPGQFVTRSFTVNIRTPQIAGRGTVKMNGHELGPPMSPLWDDKLTLEFLGTHPALSALEITRADTAVTVFLAGDSTVTEQPAEPWAGWGQMLPRFFGPGVAVADHAESGRALASFRAEQRLAKILGAMKRGDYLFIQFGHNDQKEKGEGVGPFTTYKQRLKEYIADARKAGGNAVIVTPMERRRWDPQGKPIPTLADFAEAARQVGTEENVPVIDLNAMSLKFYTALGPDGSTKAFVHYPAGTFPGQDQPLKDDTHHNAYGGYELAKCIVNGIRSQVPALARFLVKDVPPFDPSRPDPADVFDVPPSPASATEKPAGS